MSERCSWIVEKDSHWSDLRPFNAPLYKCTPVGLIGHSGLSTRVEHCSRSLLKSRPPYFVVYEGRNVPDTLCECAIQHAIRNSMCRLSHEYSWADVAWIELIAWGV